MHYSFDAEHVKNELIEWIHIWFSQNGSGCKAVVGISGGKDSTVAAALCAQALGKENVVGVMMPNVVQPDLDDSIAACEYLGIENHIIPITLPVSDALNEMEFSGIELSHKAMVNLPPRIRMSVLYAVAQSVNGRVINTSNLSERWIGWSTRWGDGVGDMSLFSQLTSSEVVQLGHALALPANLVDKAPMDGLTGKSDEENFGFSYADLDQYIRTGECRSQIVSNKINRMHAKNHFKTMMPPSFATELPVIGGVGVFE